LRNPIPGRTSAQTDWLRRSEFVTGSESPEERFPSLICSGKPYPDIRHIFRANCSRRFLLGEANSPAQGGLSDKRLLTTVWKSDVLRRRVLPMFRGLIVAVLLILVPYSCRSQKVETPISGHANAVVRDPAAAIRIARTTGTIQDPKPTAELDDGLWIVRARACCSDKRQHLTCEAGQCLGGGVCVVIRQSDGKILSTQIFK